MDIKIWPMVSMKQLIAPLFLLLLLVACGSDDSGPNAPKGLNGLWIGETTEIISGTGTLLSTHVLFHEGTVYILRKDEAQIGSYTIINNDTSRWELASYPYTSPDDTNRFYIGTLDTQESATADALFADAQRLIVNYTKTATITREGTIRITFNKGLDKAINLVQTTGDWQTEEATLTISANGNILGNHNECQFKGSLVPLNYTLLTLNLTRNSCAEFNTSEAVFGLAFFDSDNTLHFIANNHDNLLWMRFNKPKEAALPEEETPAEGEAPTEEETPTE